MKLETVYWYSRDKSVQKRCYDSVHKKQSYISFLLTHLNQPMLWHQQSNTVLIQNKDVILPV